MYTLEQLKNKVIWVFRQPRSGGSWLTSELSHRLNRNPNFLGLDEDENDTRGLKRESLLESYFQKITPNKNDKVTLFNTHEFCGLKIINKFDNPILLRLMRKNRTEQFLSLYIATNCTKVLNVNSEQEYNKLPKIEPMYASTDQIFFYIRRCKREEDYWNHYSPGYENETIYYEDMLQGYKSNILDLEISMYNNTSSKRPLSLKMPYDKREIFLNYQEIDTMLQENLGPY